MASHPSDDLLRQGERVVLGHCGQVVHPNGRIQEEEFQEMLLRLRLAGLEDLADNLERKVTSLRTAAIFGIGSSAYVANALRAEVSAYKRWIEDGHARK